MSRMVIYDYCTENMQDISAFKGMSMLFDRFGDVQENVLVAAYTEWRHWFVGLA